MVRIPPMRSHEGIHVESLAEQTYRLLREDIIQGRMRPGERIREKVLSEQLGVSRTPIREALLKLQMAGVVVCNSRRSYNVRLLTLTEVRETFEILGILEGSVVSAVASDITGEELALLEQYNEDMVGIAERGDFYAYGAWNEKFHNVFISKFNNSTLCGLCDSVRSRVYICPVRRTSLREWLRKSVGEHEEIIRLARAKDGTALGSFFREVHWSYESDQPYIEDAFAAVGGPPVPTRGKVQALRGDATADEPLVLDSHLK